MAYTTIDDPSAYFQTKIYAGTDASPQAFTLDGNSDLQPDWVWIKNRGYANKHVLFDSVRGVEESLTTNNNAGEVNQNADGGYLSAFNSDGFTLTEGSNSDNDTNDNRYTYVAWNWKAGGSASTNSSGSTNSSVSVNTDAGFSIVSYTGAGATTYGHGLGATPNVIIIKKRTSDSGNNNWFVYHDKVITAGSGIKTFLTLNETEPLKSNGSATTFLSVSSTTFGVGTDPIISESSHAFIAYCFAEKQGYSKFGDYKGNGSADGPFIYTGFQPAFVIIKATDQDGEGWFTFDNKRDADNAVDKHLIGNANGAEASGSHAMDFVSNGIKIRNGGDGTNTNNKNYVYLAFAEQPFTTSTGVPATAR